MSERMSERRGSMSERRFRYFEPIRRDAAA